MYPRALASSLGMIFLTASSLSAQDPPSKSVDKPAVTPLQFDAVFGNNSKVRMALQVEHLEIQTIYGKLKVPIKDVHSIEFGVRPPPGSAEKIGQAVKKLGSKIASEHTGAGRALLELGPHSYQAVLEATRQNGDADLRLRAQEVVKNLKQKFAIKELTRSQNDVVVVAKMAIVGQILAPSWKASVDEFGEHKIEVATLRSLRNTSAKPERSDHDLLQGTWHVTQLLVEGREENRRDAMTLIINKDQAILGSGERDEDETGTFTLGTSEKHKTIDLMLRHEGLIGIYQIEGDTLKLCLTRRGRPRPTSFEAPVGDSDQALLILTRQATGKSE